MNKKVIKLNDYTVAVILNKSVSVVQQLFSDKMVVTIGIDDIKQILKELKRKEVYETILSRQEGD